MAISNFQLSQPAVTAAQVRRNLAGDLGQVPFGEVKGHRPSTREVQQDSLLGAMVSHDRFKRLLIEQLGSQAWASGNRSAGLQFQARFRNELGCVPDSLRRDFWLATRRWMLGWPVGWRSRRTQDFVADRLRIGRNLDEGLSKMRVLSGEGVRFSVSLAGEMVTHPKAADDYRDANLQLLRRLVEEHEGPAMTSNGPHGVPVLEISLKPTSLSDLFRPETWDEGIEDAVARALPIALLAKQCAAQRRPSS